MQLPEGTAPEHAWALVKISRMLEQKPTALLDADGTPFTYWLPDSALRDIYCIDDQKARCFNDDPSISAEDMRRYMIKASVDEAISSSQLEGVSSSRDKAKEMLRTGRRPRDRSEQAIADTFETIQLIRKRVREPLSPDLLLDMHARLAGTSFGEATVPGRFRTVKDPIPELCDAEGKVVLYTPPNGARIAGYIDALCAFVNGETRDQPLPPVIKGILLHFWLAYVRPFQEANGIIARLLFHWYMLKRGYRMFEYLSLSTALLNTRDQYERAFLLSNRDENDATYFVVYNLNAILRALEFLQEYLQTKKKEKKQSYLFAMSYAGLNARQRMLLASALEHPGNIFTIELHANVHGITYQTARTDLLGLQKLDLLQMKKVGKKFIFTPVHDLPGKIQA